MSLLDKGTDTVLVWVEEIVDDGRGNRIRRPSATPVTVENCRVQPVASDLPVVDGQQASTVYRISRRELPGGAWARIEWDGRQWDLIGEPARHHGSDRTRHHSVLIRARKAANVEVP